MEVYIVIDKTSHSGRPLAVFKSHLDAINFCKESDLDIDECIEEHEVIE